MYQIDVSTASATLPSPAALGTPGYFTDGDLIGGVAPTIVPADFLNAVMLELLNVVTAAGIAPSKSADNQLVLSIKALVGQIAASTTAITTTGGATVLTATQASCQYLIVSGVLTANAGIVVPASFGKWTVINNTTGNFSVSTYCTGGGGVPIFQGSADTVFCDGSNVRYVETSAVTRGAGDSSKACATTEFATGAIATAVAGLQIQIAALQSTTDAATQFYFAQL